MSVNDTSRIVIDGSRVMPKCGVTFTIIILVQAADAFLTYWFINISLLHTEGLGTHPFYSLKE